MQAAVLGGAFALLLIIWVAARICRISTPQLPGIQLDEIAAQLVDEAARDGRLWIVASRPEPDQHNDRGPRSIPPPADIGPALLLEVAVPVHTGHPSTLTVTGQRRSGQLVLRAEAWDVADAIAAVLLHLRDRTGLTPRVHFTWSDRNPLAQFVQFLLLGTGEIILLTRQLLREAEPDPNKRPTVHVG